MIIALIVIFSIDLVIGIYFGIRDGIRESRMKQDTYHLMRWASDLALWLDEEGFDVPSYLSYYRKHYDSDFRPKPEFEVINGGKVKNGNEIES